MFSTFAAHGGCIVCSDAAAVVAGAGAWGSRRQPALCRAMTLSCCPTALRGIYSNVASGYSIAVQLSPHFNMALPNEIGVQKHR